MNSDDFVKELWSTANIITGFSVAQSLGFAIALGKDLKPLQEQATRVKIVIGGFCILFGLIYSFGIWRCYALAMSLDSMNSIIWREATCGRIFAVFLMSGVSIFGLFAPDIFKRGIRAPEARTANNQPGLTFRLEQLDPSQGGKSLVRICGCKEKAKEACLSFEYLLVLSTIGNFP